jgi:hypothetical protein
MPTPAPHLPGEPLRDPLTGPRLLLRLGLRVGLLVAAAPIWTALWLLLALSALRWGWPPHLPDAAELRRVLRDAASAEPGSPLLPPARRAWVAAGALVAVAWAPVRGLAWQLDELLDGRSLDAVDVTAPLIEISAARSGSTQLARYLEADPRLIAPSVLQAMFPYLWLWRLMKPLLRRPAGQALARWAHATLVPPEFIERHEGDLLRTDTFEAGFYLNRLTLRSLSLGPAAFVREFGFASDHPEVRAAWERRFVPMFDRIARKVLLQAGPGRRYFAKGHFLAAAGALQARYPDASFLTLRRDPVACVQSQVNFMRAHVIDRVAGATPWPWLAVAVPEMQLAYQREEDAWLSAPGPARRCVVDFDAFVADLPGTLRKVYAEALDAAPPSPLPDVHAARRRGGYALNRSLAQAGVDEGALRARFGVRAPAA